MLSAAPSTPREILKVAFYRFLNRWVSDESGQDITEYSLLLAIVALAASALFLHTGGSISGIWCVTRRIPQVVEGW